MSKIALHRLRHGLTVFSAATLFHYSSTSSESRKLNVKFAHACLSKNSTIERVGAHDPNGCGEDSWVIKETPQQVCLAVADGVGGWRSKGVDPSQFSRCLMRQAGLAIEQSPGFYVDSFTALRKAFWGLVGVWSAGKEKPFGSSTACLVGLNKQTGELDIANLGDSGCMILRPNGESRLERIFRTPVQQTRFNAPYQTTLTPDGHVNDQTPLADHTRHADVQPGDLIVLATDGLWDNVWEHEIINLLQQGHSLEKSAMALVRRAREYGEMETGYDSPVVHEGRLQGKRGLSGGKLDDITVILAVIVEE